MSAKAGAAGGAGSERKLKADKTFPCTSPPSVKPRFTVNIYIFKFFYR
jgi:hypothetical protein